MLPQHAMQSHIISSDLVSFYITETYHTVQYHIKRSTHIKPYHIMSPCAMCKYTIAMFVSVLESTTPHRVTPAISTVSPKAERKKGAQVLPRSRVTPSATLSVCWSEGVKRVQLTIQSVGNYIPYVYIYICTNTTIIRISSWETKTVTNKWNVWKVDWDPWFSTTGWLMIGR